MEKYIFKETLKAKLHNPQNVSHCNILVDKGRETSSFDIHTHDFSEFVVIISGKATHVIGQEEYTVKEGDAFVINGDIPHGYKNCQELRLYNIPFITEKVFENSSDLKKIPGFQALFVLEPFYRKEHEFKSRLTLSTTKLSYALGLLSLMEDEFKEQKAGFMEAIQGLFLALVVFLSREYASGKSSIPGQIMSMAETIAYMESFYKEPLTLQKLADMACFSRRQFVRIFKQNYMLTPSDYLLRLRIQHACLLLKDKNAAISHIAAESGFPDSNYFSRVFKKETGMTPADFRKKYSTAY